MSCTFPATGWYISGHNILYIKCQISITYPVFHTCHMLTFPVTETPPIPLHFLCSIHTMCLHVLLMKLLYSIHATTQLQNWSCTTWKLPCPQLCTNKRYARMDTDCQNWKCLYTAGTLHGHIIYACVLLMATV